jgi:hypothetical protein
MIINYGKNFNLKKIIIFNIFFVIIIFFLSLFFSKKLPFVRTYEYTDIRINPLVSEFLIFQRNILKNDHYFSSYTLEKFITEYIEYFNSNKNLHALAPCPSEVLGSDLRNIQIYKIIKGRFNQKFNVRIKNNNFYKNNFNIDKCFNYIFIENFNEYFLKSIQHDNKIIETHISLLKKLYRNNKIIDYEVDDQIEKLELILGLSSKLKNYTIDNYSNSNDNKNNTVYIFLVLLLVSATLQIMYFKFKKLNIKNILKFINS